MYELSGIGGSIGLSPHPQHWHRFIKNYGTQMRTCPPGMGCPQSEIWEPWWFYYVSTNRLFTLYLANSLTMASNYREMGVHQKIFTPANKDFDNMNARYVVVSGYYNLVQNILQMKKL